MKIYAVVPKHVVLLNKLIVKFKALCNNKSIVHKQALDVIQGEVQ